MSGTTYLGSSLAKMAGNHFIPGSGDAVTSITARAKSDLLRDILQQYFHDDRAYAGGDIALNDAKQAIKYARSKKLTKSNRKAVIAGAKFVGFVAGTATGATLGSVVPVAGTAVGGVAGGVAIGTVASGGVSALDQLKRKTKGLYKMIRGTRGEHRHQAARALLYCNGTFPANDPKHDASFDALVVILDEEFEEVVLRMPLEAAVERLADRMKSN
jgi:hypothetical protein